MATVLSTTLEEPTGGITSLQAEAGDDPVETLTREGLIGMRDAALLYGRKTHKSTPTRHAQRGIKLANGTVLKLESIKVSGAVCTSKAAVLRFFAAQQAIGVEVAPVAPALKPRGRRSAAEAASAKVGELLGTK